MSKNFDDLPMLMTVSEMAKVLRVGRNAAYQLVADGRIRSIRIGHGIRVPRKALIEFIEQPQSPPQ